MGGQGGSQRRLAMPVPKISKLPVQEYSSGSKISPNQSFVQSFKSCNSSPYYTSRSTRSITACLRCPIQYKAKGINRALRCITIMAKVSLTTRILCSRPHQQTCVAGKNRGPEYPWNCTLSISILPSCVGLQSFSSTYLPDLFDSQHLQCPDPVGGQTGRADTA
jgi:hypothetical protein